MESGRPSEEPMYQLNKRCVGGFNANSGLADGLGREEEGNGEPWSNSQLSTLTSNTYLCYLLRRGQQGRNRLGRRRIKITSSVLNWLA